MEISPREARYQRLIQTRNKYSSVARSKASKFRTQMEQSKEKMLFEEQRREMEEIEAELEAVRNQYHKICKERGTAHLSAKLVQRQEQEMIDFESRRDQLTRFRAEKVAKQKEMETRAKVKENQSKKKEKLTKRKEIFNRDWTACDQTATKSVDKASSVKSASTFVKKSDGKSAKRQEVEAQLAKLVQIEKDLEQKIEKKKIERQAKDVPVFELSSDSNTSSDDGSDPDPHFVGRYVRHPPSGHHHHHHHHHEHGTKVQSNKPNERKSDSGFLEKDLISDPDLMTRNVLHKLEQMKEQMRMALEAVAASKDSDGCDKTHLYKDTGVNTSKKSVMAEELPSSTTTTSSSTASSYKSLPKGLNPKKREFAVLIQKLKEQLTTNERQTRTKHVDGGDGDNQASRTESEEGSSGAVQSFDCSSPDMERYKAGHADRLKFWEEVCNEAGTVLHEETAAALLNANFSDASKKITSSPDLSDSLSNDGDNDSDGNSEESVIIHECREEEVPGHSTPKVATSSPSTVDTIQGILEERSLTFASSFSSSNVEEAN